MRLFVFAIALFLALVAPVSAQQMSSSSGVVTADLQPARLDLVPHESQTVTGWFNGTIECEPNYTPKAILVEVNRRSLETEDGRELWSIDPTNVLLDLGAIGGNRFEVRKVAAFTLQTNPEAVGQTGQIEFLLFRTGNGFPSNDCSMWGTRWTFDEPAYIDVAVAAPENQTDNGSLQNAGAPSTLAPMPLVAEGGPVRGESHVPTEAFVSMGTVLALFSSYGVYEWRRVRKD